MNILQIAEDGVVELPFLPAIGIQSSYEGPAQIKAFMITSGNFIRTSASNRRIRRF
jgi:hypothetical protein